MIYYIKTRQPTEHLYKRGDNIKKSMKKKMF